jgi:hypothetical protein
MDRFISPEGVELLRFVAIFLFAMFAMGVMLIASCRETKL